MARRGFFAEVQHQLRVAAREHERAEKEVVRRRVAAVRQAEKARIAAERAHAQMLKASVAERKRLEKEVREAHVAAKEAEAYEKNERLEEIYEEIDSLLASTLKKDDYVDLATLRVTATHPPFDRTDLESAIPKPVAAPLPSKPVLVPPSPPSGLNALFGKKKHAEEIANAQLAYERALAEWRAACRNAMTRRQKAEQEHAQQEIRRIEALNAERERYAKERATREAEAAAQNRKLDELIANLGYGTTEAIQEYVSIVLSNSVYPDHFPVDHEFEFDSSTAELRLRVLVPSPAEVPSVKSYKYTKNDDQIVASSLPQKAIRERYAGAVNQIALRSFHEVFESDRRGLIKTISLEVGVSTIDPATGQPVYVPFVIAAAERENFLTFDLSAVVPALTLDRLGGSVSKNPAGLIATERSGVRRS